MAEAANAMKIKLGILRAISGAASSTQVPIKPKPANKHTHESGPRIGTDVGAISASHQRSWSYNRAFAVRQQTLQAQHDFSGRLSAAPDLVLG